MLTLPFSISAAALAALAAGAAPGQAQAPGAGQAPAAASPSVTVRAPERLICRPTARTGTRVGTQATCRTQREWETGALRPGERSYRTIDEAADALGIMGDKCNNSVDGCL